MTEHVIPRGETRVVWQTRHSSPNSPLAAKLPSRLDSAAAHALECEARVPVQPPSQHCAHLLIYLATPRTDFCLSWSCWNGKGLGAPAEAGCVPHACVN